MLILLFMLGIVFAGYVEMMNINSKEMTYRQKVLKAVYPVFSWWTRMTGKKTVKRSEVKRTAPVSFYSLKGTLNNGEHFDFVGTKGKKILLVNTATDCGYTGQLEDLQKLYEENKDRLLVIAFPANDFKHQEKGTDEEIARFCKLNYGVSFPLMKKSVVIKTEDQNEVFQWLTDSSKNGWNNKPPSWNFSKYLVNETGQLVNYFGPTVEPLAKEILEEIGKEE
jgi:glutathione peroxidase